MNPNHAIYEAEVTRQFAAGEPLDPLHVAGCRPGFVAALTAPASPALPPSRHQDRAGIRRPVRVLGQPS